MLSINFIFQLVSGFLLYPEHGNNLSTLFKNADIAMYAAKSGKREIFLLY
ncbi:diguanylate cyclase [Anaerobacillus sp. HL2]|nr:diguanylate cyclase [Anaerobacillus sp. HL2]